MKSVIYMRTPAAVINVSSLGHKSVLLFSSELRNYSCKKKKNSETVTPESLILLR